MGYVPKKVYVDWHTKWQDVIINYLLYCLYLWTGEELLTGEVGTGRVTGIPVGPDIHRVALTYLYT